MAKNSSVSELIRPTSLSIKKNPETLFNSLSDGIKEALSDIGWRSKSASGDSFPDIARHHLRFPTKGSASEDGDHWTFFRTWEKIEQEVSHGPMQADRFKAADRSLTSLIGQGIKSDDKTLVYCREENDNTEIEFHPDKSHRIALHLNPNKTDDYIAALQVAAYRQEQFREYPLKDNELPFQNALMPDRAWCEENKITITPSRNNDRAFYISSSRTQEQEKTMPLQEQVIGKDPSHKPLRPADAATQAPFQPEDMSTLWNLLDASRDDASRQGGPSLGPESHGL